MWPRLQDSCAIVSAVTSDLPSSSLVFTRCFPFYLGLERCDDICKMHSFPRTENVTIVSDPLNDVEMRL